MIVSLSDMKTHLNISGTGYDTFLTEQLTLVQAAVEGYCNRKFEQASYEQTFYPEDFSSQLPLYHYPVENVVVEMDGETLVEGTDYRVHKASGTLIFKNWVSPCFDTLVVGYDGGYDSSDMPVLVTSAVKSIVEGRYNKKVAGVDLNFGSDVQRLSVPGVISIDFDYTLTTNERSSAFGVIVGSNANILDYYRSDRAALAPGRLQYVD